MPCCSEIAFLWCGSGRWARNATFGVLLGKRKIRLNATVTAHAPDFFWFTVYQDYGSGLFRQKWEYLDFLIILLLRALSLYGFLLASSSLLEAIHLISLKCRYLLFNPHLDLNSYNWGIIFLPSFFGWSNPSHSLSLLMSPPRAW